MVRRQERQDATLGKKKFTVIKESDIFGGTQWTKEQQYREEITSLCAQIYNTIESYKKLSRKEKKKLEGDIGNFKFALMEYNL